MSNAPHTPSTSDLLDMVLIHLDSYIERVIYDQNGDFSYSRRLAKEALRDSLAQLIAQKLDKPSEVG